MKIVGGTRWLRGDKMLDSIRIQYTIQAKIKRIWQHHDKKYVAGFGPDTVFDETDAGWFVSFEGSGEALFLGATPPTDWKVGDIINISYVKAGP